MLAVSIIAGVLVIALGVMALKSLRSRKKASPIVLTNSKASFETSEVNKPKVSDQPLVAEAPKVSDQPLGAEAPKVSDQPLGAEAPVLMEKISLEEVPSVNSRAHLRVNIVVETDPLQELEKANAQINPQSSFIAEVIIRRLLQALCSTIISNSDSADEDKFLERISAIFAGMESQVSENSTTNILKFQISKSGLAAAKIQLGDRSFTVLLGDRRSITRNVAQVPTRFEIIASEDRQAELAPLFVAIDGLVYGAIQFEIYSS